MERLTNNNRGQVTLFIVIGLLIVSAILIFFLYIEPTYISEGTGVKGFDGCIEDVLEDGISNLEVRAGLIDADFRYDYKSEELSYL